MRWHQIRSRLPSGASKQLIPFQCWVCPARIFLAASNTWWATIRKGTSWKSKTAHAPSSLQPGLSESKALNRCQHPFIRDSVQSQLRPQQLLTYLSESINDVLNKLCLVRLKKLQGRAANVAPVEGHEVATLKVLPVGEENDCAVLNLLHPAGKWVGEASVSGVLGNVS